MAVATKRVIGKYGFIRRHSIYPIPLLLLAGCGGGGSAVTPTATPNGTSLLANFSTTVDAQKWVASDGWSNGGMFNVGWVAGNASVASNALALQLDDQCSVASTCSGKPYKSGEFSSIGKYGYGRISTSMQAAKGAGVVTSLFTYNATPHDEIDIEFLGKDTTQVQFNYFVNGVGGHEQVVDLGFDASAARHNYAIEWRTSGIAWYVDGILKYQVSGGSLPSAPGQVMVNLWAATGVDGWTGPFTYPGPPIKAYYDYIRYDSF